MQKFLFILLFIIVVSGFLVFLKNAQPESSSLSQNEKSTDFVEHDNVIEKNNTGKEELKMDEKTEKNIVEPIKNANERITKKPFGILIDPATSSVQPERFSGFHTGTDFEIFPEELSERVEVFAICDGKIIQKSHVGGYGGVIMQQCKLHDEAVTVLYGHVSLSSSPVKLNDLVKSGEMIAVLGADKSSDTDGERKHLHLGIHRGESVDLRGYVQSEGQLETWLDFEKLILNF